MFLDFYLEFPKYYFFRKVFFYFIWCFRHYYFHHNIHHLHLNGHRFNGGNFKTFYQNDQNSSPLTHFFNFNMSKCVKLTKIVQVFDLYKKYFCQTAKYSLLLILIQIFRFMHQKSIHLYDLLNRLVSFFAFFFT